MIKICCDLCGKEIYKEHHAYTWYAIKRKKYPHRGKQKWEEIVAHDYCVKELLKRSEEINNAD